MVANQSGASNFARAVKSSGGGEKVFVGSFFFFFFLRDFSNALTSLSDFTRDLLSSSFLHKQRTSK